MREQRIASQYPAKPLTVDDLGEPGEQEITTQVDPPLGDPALLAGTVQVAPTKADGDQVCNDGEVARYWQFRARLEGSGISDEANIIIWGWSRWSETWAPLANIAVARPAAVCVGNVLVIDGILGTTYIYMQACVISDNTQAFVEMIPGN